MARGGRRAGNRGQNYPNRSDLASALPLNAPTGLPYGDRQKLISAQRAVPMGPAPSSGAMLSGRPGVAAGPSAPGGGSPPPQPGAKDFLRPTERPNEPVTAGLALGPGPGPEALGPLAQNGGGSTVGSLLESLAASPNATPEIRALATYSKGGK